MDRKKYNQSLIEQNEDRNYYFIFDHFIDVLIISLHAYSDWSNSSQTLRASKIKFFPF